MIHVQISRAERRLRALDIGKERFSCAALVDDRVPNGHFRPLRVIEIAPPTRDEGDGRLIFCDLIDRHLDAIETSEGFGFVNGIAQPVGALVPLGGTSHCCGGGGRSVSQALCNYQALVPSMNGVRLQNADFRKLLTWLIPHWRSDRQAILTIH